MQMSIPSSFHSFSAALCSTKRFDFSVSQVNSEFSELLLAGMFSSLPRIGLEWRVLRFIQVCHNQSHRCMATMTRTWILQSENRTKIHQQIDRTQITAHLRCLVLHSSHCVLQRRLKHELCTRMKCPKQALNNEYYKKLLYFCLFFTTSDSFWG